MATITLKYDGRNPLAKKVIDFVLSLGIFEKNTLKFAIHFFNTNNIHTFV